MPHVRPVAFALLPAIPLALLLRRTPDPRLRRWLPWILLAGTMLRLWYVLVTPASMRAYDFQGHFEYIQYVFLFDRIPPYVGGWEYFQPPLYYASAAAWSQGWMALGEPAMALPGLQAFSLLLSIVALWAGIGIGQVLFGKDGALALAFAAFLAAYPGLLAFASRLTNDALLITLTFCALLALLRYRATGGWRDWLTFSALAGFALLTKTNPPTPPPPGAPTLALRRPGWTAFFARGAACAAVALGIAGWSVIPRALDQMERGVFPIGNIESLSSKLEIPVTLGTLTTLHPHAVVAQPYADTWATDGSRDYFWDFLLRSAYFGEFDFGETLAPLATAILLVTLLLMPAGIAGVWTELRRRSPWAVPMLALACLLLASQLSMRIHFPHSPIQDFRLSMPACLSAAYFALRGIGSFKGLLRHAQWDLFLLLCALCALFVAGVGVGLAA